MGSLVLAAPAQGEPAPRSRGAAHDQAAILVDAGRGAVLPFARLDLAILVLGGAVLTVAAVSAPLLLPPLRRGGPAANPLLTGARQGAGAHATA